MKSVNEFDGGIACIIRGAPENFEQSMLECELIEPTNSDFVHELERGTRQQHHQDHN